MTQRSDQLASAIDRAVRDVIIRGFHDPRISGLITVTGVKVTQDGRDAFVKISVYPAEKAQLTVHGLQNAAAFIRREVGDMIRIRTMPQLSFQLDDSLKKQAEVIAALEKVKAEQTKDGPAPSSFFSPASPSSSQSPKETSQSEETES